MHGRRIYGDGLYGLWNCGDEVEWFEAWKDKRGVPLWKLSETHLRVWSGKLAKKEDEEDDEEGFDIGQC